MRNSSRGLRRYTFCLLYWSCFVSLFTLIKCGDLWPMDKPEDMPSIQSLEVMCGKDHMDVHLTFSHPFEGIVSSKGQHGDPRCVYVPPLTGQSSFSFRIAYTRCGTKPDLHGQFYENTVVVQYDKDLLEVWDEAKRLRCEWFNDYEKTASKPPMVIADLDVIQLDFKGDNVDCWMEIQHGKGPWAPPVTGIVPLGSTLTLVVAINDYKGEFDMRVKSCIASDGDNHIIELSDDKGCVLRPKMISRFLKARGVDDRASIITYAFFHAFKFPDTLSVHIKCKVEVCRHGCLDHCQDQLINGVGNDFEDHFNSIERKDTNNNNKKIEDDNNNVASIDIGAGFPSNGKSNKKNNGNKRFSSDVGNEIAALPFKGPFPHGPRQLEEQQIGTPRSLSDLSDTTTIKEDTINEKIKSRKKRHQILDRKTRSADVGVSGIYKVISEADLAFSPDAKTESVTIFQGKIREEVIYGICMPVPGFSALFVMIAISAAVSTLVAVSLLYRYQLQKENSTSGRQIIESQTLQLSTFTNVMKLFKHDNNNKNGVNLQDFKNGKVKQEISEIEQ
ncbi:uncharacterized protein [Onthophagus taurus]|uniref:uncharacterized protein n=1 Tax=Onthophagus taurus TaxID=166361 RepID=UPI000C207627|nr:uncharacterized protein LOC111416093 [Onthophagus taurus]